MDISKEIIKAVGQDTEKMLREAVRVAERNSPMKTGFNRQKIIENNQVMKVNDNEYQLKLGADYDKFLNEGTKRGIKKYGHWDKAYDFIKRY